MTEPVFSHPPLGRITRPRKGVAGSGFILSVKLQNTIKVLTQTGVSVLHCDFLYQCGQCSKCEYLTEGIELISGRLNDVHETQVVWWIIVCV